MLASSPINSSPILGPGPAGIVGGNVGQTTGAGGAGTPTASGGGASTKYLAKQDREALLQFTKHFVRKAVQIIVQSRLGDKKPTKSRVYAYNADWFNLSVKDLTQITNMTKQSLGNVEAIFTDNTPFCVEISLRTPENQTMILETWCILFNEQLVDTTQKICYSVYKKMSLVLRSLICLTRSIPTYQLSRRQNSDTYVLLYRMYCGEPIVHHLGENYGTGKVGTVGTPIGSLIVNVAYRTRLTMTPQNSSHAAEYGGGIQIKEDHFTIAHQQQQQPHSINHQQQQQQQTPQRYTPNNSRPAAGSASSPDLNPPTYDDMMGNYSPPPPTAVDMRSPRPAFGYNNDATSQQSSSASPAGPRRSTSNLNTIAEASTSQTPDTPTRSSNTRATSKTQPIPMKSSQSQPAGISASAAAATGGGQPSTNQGANTSMTPRTNQSVQSANRNHLQMQRYGETAQHQEETSSADEYSSSVGSTSDTIYYFKLKSAAFVPSATATSNPHQYYSSSFGNLHDNDLPPFIALLSNDFTNLSAGHQPPSDSSQQLAIAQSPPPPGNLIEFSQQGGQQQQRGGQQRSRTGTAAASQSVSSQDDRIASPCSLPNFKMLDNHAFLNMPNNAAASHGLNQLEPDDFVFIESKKIAFGLSNAADDLRNFFRACENAPMLDSFQNEPSFNDVLKDLDHQLLSYESKVAEFDDLVKSLENN